MGYELILSDKKVILFFKIRSHEIWIVGQSTWSSPHLSFGKNQINFSLSWRTSPFLWSFSHSLSALLKLNLITSFWEPCHITASLVSVWRHSIICLHIFSLGSISFFNMEILAYLLPVLLPFHYFLGAWKTDWCIHYQMYESRNKRMNASASA